MLLQNANKATAQLITQLNNDSTVDVMVESRSLYIVKVLSAETTDDKKLANRNKISLRIYISDHEIDAQLVFSQSPHCPEQVSKKFNITQTYELMDIAFAINESVDFTNENFACQIATFFAEISTLIKLSAVIKNNILIVEESDAETIKRSIEENGNAAFKFKDSNVTFNSDGHFLYATLECMYVRAGVPFYPDLFENGEFYHALTCGEFNPDELFSLLEKLDDLYMPLLASDAFNNHDMSLTNLRLLRKAA